MIWNPALRTPATINPKPRRLARRIAGWTAVILSVTGLILAAAPALHLLGSEPFLIYPARNRPIPIAAVMLSGDIGFRGGMSSPFATALADRGMTVVGVSSPVVFAFHRTRADATAVVAQAIRIAMKISGTRHVILVGQSFGADVVAAVLPGLPRDLLARIDVIDLMVPGRDVFFRADPVGLAYLGKPDAQPANTLKAFRGPPLICIYGVEETDSLCPLLVGSAAIFGLPGDHHLHHDHARLVTTAMGALHGVIPSIRS